MFKYLLAGALALAITSAHAQERTAGSALETQMTWSTLSAQAKAASDKADAVNSKMEQAIVCSKRGMLYAPGAGDAQGCLEASKANATTTNISKLESLINTNNTNLTNTVNAQQSSINNIINCNRNGQVFNGSGCVAPAGTVLRGTLCGVTSYSSEEGSPLVFPCNGIDPKSGCPSGWQSVYAPIRGGGHGQSLGFCVKQ